ncbi:MAG: choice-of-anchor Q domain-containing protein [Chthoniobacterales bacterium]
MRARLILPTVAWFVIAFGPGIAAASTWTVTTTDDHTVGFCTSNDCTLREAITIAGNGDVIQFAPTVTGTITLGGAGELFLQQNITINGPGANLLTINGANATRIFEIQVGSTVSISGLTITNGFVGGAGGEGQGGGILNNGKLNLTACELTTNAINVTDAGGGAGRALGGGLFNGNGSTAVIRNCTFEFNSVQASEAWGGGMASRSASVIVINSTFSNNVLRPAYGLNSGEGGGVFAFSATVTLLNCTIAFNLPASGGTTTGGGIAQTNGSAVILRNTLIAGNTADQAPDASGPFYTLGHNLVSNNSGGSTQWQSTDKVDGAAAPSNLGGLVYNGGPTKTHAISAGSVAIDNGDDTAKDPGPDGVFGNADDVPLNIDQRGYPRPVGAHLDIGAFEFESPQPGPSFTVTTTDEHSDGVCGVGDCSLWDAANAANAHPGSTIQFQAGLSGTITTKLQASGINLVAPVTVVGPGARTLTISGAGLGRMLNVQSRGVVISGLTFANGHFTSNGGAILNNNGDLSLTDCEFFNNVVVGTGSSGGAIANETTHRLSLRNCTFSGNQASGSGGAVYDSAGSLAATNSTFTGNTATVIGGGIGIQTGSKADLFDIVNCTLSGNTNSVRTVGGGAGIFTASDNIVSIGNTIVAGNICPGCNPDASGPYTSQGSNLIGDGSGTSGFTASGDQVGTSGTPIDPKLDTLKNNGGPTDTMALLDGSPAIDAGNDVIAPATDQRGLGRVGKSDIGAFEVQPPPPTPTPTATPAGFVANVSTRLPVGTNENVLIEGFIVQGLPGSTKKLIVRAIGPSLVPFGIPDALANPTLEIHDSSNLIAMNNDWKVTQTGGIIAGDQSAEIGASGLAPSNDLESAIIANLAPGSYTAVVQGAGGTTGTGVVDAYDLSAASSARLANIATRGLVQPDDKLMIAGFIIQNGPVRVVVTALGPSLLAFGVNNALPDTTLELHDQNGVILLQNDNWKTDQQADLESTGLQPSNDLEAALVTTIQPGQYTAQVRGKNNASGIGVVQVYFLQ